MSQTMTESEEDAQRYDLDRFLQAQASIYDAALDELKRGRKQSHWMWYIFPQFAGLGYSETSKHYAVQSLEEAQAYLDHPLLGSRLRECAAAVLAVKGKSARDIFDRPDDVKLQSSMTLFAQVSEPDSVFHSVLAKYFDGQQDTQTRQLLARTGKQVS